jgi:hypothetical protein
VLPPAARRTCDSRKRPFHSSSYPMENGSVKKMGFEVKLEELFAAIPV